MYISTGVLVVFVCINKYYLYIDNIIMGYMHTCTYICKYKYIITFTCVHTGVPPYILTYMLLLYTKLHV